MQRKNVRTKVAAVNFHFAHNHGAVLQALSLQDRFESLNVDFSTIDYRPRGHWHQYAIYPNPVFGAIWKFRGSRAAGLSFTKSLKRSVARAINSIRSYRNLSGRKVRSHLFESYINTHLRLTRRYTSIRQLRLDPPKANLYVVGSDQVWNPTNTGGLDPAYYLRFGHRNVTRVGYAVSPCQLNVSLHADSLKEYLTYFDHLTLREADILPDLQSLTVRKISTVPDPVLLMTAEQLKKYCTTTNQSEKGYILLYAVRTSETIPVISQIIARVATTLQLEVIDVSLEYIPWSFPVTRPEKVDPGSFINYISNAKHVVSNSFHATVLSLLFEREFSVATAQGTSARITELLDFLDVGERAYNTDSNCDVSPIKIDYSIVSPKIALLRNTGMNFLKDIVSSSNDQITDLP